MTFHDLSAYIKAQAVKFKAAEEGWDYDTIELDTFREILRFAIGAGFQADAKAMDRVLNGEDENSEDEEDDHTDWHFMGLLMEEMEKQIRTKVLDTETEALYRKWVTESRGEEANFEE